jgi:hypothetical protein
MPKIIELAQELVLPVDGDVLAMDDISDSNVAKKVTKLNLLKTTQDNIDVNTSDIGDNATDIAANTAAIAAITSGQTGLFQQAFYNPMGKEMVDQDGNDGTTIASADYAIDGWKVNEVGTDPLFNILTDGVELLAQATESGKFSFNQYIESANADIIAGLEYTSSFLVTSVNTNARVLLSDDDGSTWTVGDTHTGDGTEKILSVTKTISSSPGQIICMVGIASSTNGTVSVTNGLGFQARGAIFNKGATRIEVAPRRFEDELFLCHRHYWKYSPPNGYHFASGRSSASILDWALTTPTIMRALPTYSLGGSGATNWQCNGGNGTLVTTSVVGQDGNRIAITGTATGITVTHSASVGWGGGVGYIVLDSRL